MTIREKVSDIIKKYKTRNPYELAEALNVILLIVPLKGVNGFYNYYKRNHIIYINEALSSTDREIVLSHELGHLFLHGKTNTIYLNTYTDVVTSRFEKEADTFASELLISDDTILEYKDYTIEKLAKLVGVYPKHVKLKLEGYNKKITKR